MTEHVNFLLLGLGNGAVFAALALALVVTFRSSGVINFATGAMAMFAAYIYAFLRQGELLILVPGLPKSVDVGGPLGFWPAALIALAMSAALGLVLYVAVFRPLRSAPPLAPAVASIGILVVLQAVVALQVGTSVVGTPQVFPNDRYDLGSVSVTAGRIWFAGTVVIVALIVAAGYRYTRFGLATRAAAETERGAVVSGIQPDRIAAVNWMLSLLIAGIAGILISTLTPLSPLGYTLFIVPALAAATVGRFQALIPAVIAGLAIGMLQADAAYAQVKYPWLPQQGLAELIPLVLILGVLVIGGKPLPTRGAIIRQTLGRAPRPRSLLTPTIVGIAIGAVALLATSGTWRAAVIGTMITAVIALSLVVVTGFAGQVSLAQLALAGTAAFVVGPITDDWGIPFPFAPILAALFATAVGVLVGLPALRVRGLSLAIVTLALAAALEAAWFRNTDLVSASGVHVPPPDLFGLDLGTGSGSAFPRLEFGFLCLIVLAIVAWSVARLRLSRLGSAMLAVRANERSAAAAGVNVVRLKIASFAIASFIAGLGGSLLAYRRGVVTFDSFAALAGLSIFATAYLAGITSVSGGLLAGVLGAAGIFFIAIDRWFDLGNYYEVITGAALVVTVILNPEGIVAPAHTLADRIAAIRTRRAARTAPGPARPTEQPRLHAAPSLGHTGTALTVENLKVAYGGVVAVTDVSLALPEHAIVGLIGPNGAGKTTLIDAVTGFAPYSGRVTLEDRSLDGLKPHQRVHAGLSRTFQGIELYDDLSTEENVVIGLTGSSHRGGNADVLDRTLAVLHLDTVRERPAGDLSQGERQLVSVARALVAEPTVLLLDEPAAGLDSSESQWLGDRLCDVRDSGVTILLVDHDVALVLHLVDELYVLDFGEVIASGPPEIVRTDTRVSAAYLGTTHAATVTP